MDIVGPRRLDGRTLYVLLKLADLAVEKLSAYGSIDRYSSDADDDKLLAIALQIPARRARELKSAVDNARYVLEHVTFEVDPPHREQHTMAVHGVASDTQAAVIDPGTRYGASVRS